MTSFFHQIKYKYTKRKNYLLKNESQNNIIATFIQ
jgi:hypothetical protein